MNVLLKELDIDIPEQNGLEAAVLQSVRFFRADNSVEISMHVPHVLSCEGYRCVCDRIHTLTGSAVRLIIHADDDTMSFDQVQKYLGLLFEKDEFSLLREGIVQYDTEHRQLRFVFADEDLMQRASASLSGLEEFLRDIGIHNYHAGFEVSMPKETDIPELPLDFIPVPEPEEVKPKKEFRSSGYRRTKPEDYTKIELKEVRDPMQNITFDADVFNVVNEETRKNKTLIQTVYLYDGTDAITMKRFEGRGMTREELEQLHPGMRIRFYGRIEYDTFARDLTCMAQHIEVLETKQETDTAETKRIEFHMHTNMSEMDGICDAPSIVNYAYNIGHRGIVLTDHLDVQSFVKAYNTAAGIRKKDPERNFRLGLGCEMNMVNDRMLIVRNGNDTPLDECTFVSYDLETTGLSAHYDSMIEFGAVKIRDSQVIDHIQMFIRPPHPIPANISALTNITNDMVKNAPTFAEAADTLLEWIGDAVLVAHNATFDYHFFNAELRRIGREPIHNPVIDTLDMSRAVLRDRRAYRLGNIARNYRISYNEEVAHRADYDADVLGSVFLCLMKDAMTKSGARTVNDLQNVIQDDSVYSKQRRSHVCVVAKNGKGVHDLYRLVSESNTKTLAVMGKASGKEGTDVSAEARIRRSSLQKYRDNLLIGSACLNGEVFELGCNGDDARLENAIRFYDYIELQPLSCYSVFLATGGVPDLNRLKQVQKRIIDMAKKCGVPVVADSDAHYLTKQQKVFRDVYIMNQGVGGVIHPLYIRDDALRWRTRSPDQHLRFTDEMKKEFAWLGDEDLIDEITVRNPNRLFDLIEDARPVPEGTYPPKIEGSDRLLRDICNQTAMDMYGFEGKVPEIVTERLNQELDNIIRHGFDVHYYIAHLLVKKSNEDGYVVGSRGSVGSSFTATMSGVTEVNPLRPHYLCPKCHYSEWIEDPEIKSGFDLPDKTCPHCGAVMKGNGQNIPFQTFLGFNADKVPDIDLNFSNEYQARAHAFIKEVFGEEHAFRAGTISGVKDKTAYGYVSGYCEKMNIPEMRRAMREYLVAGITEVKRTTGQHPGGIIIIPEGYDAEDFTPVQFPANDPSSTWKTTHYDFHDIHDNVLKFDILGHVDPTAMRMLQTIGTMKPLDIPMNDPETLSLFSSDAALKADTRIYHQETGALGLPEFGTRITRSVLEETRPKKFSDLVILSGLTHGTDVWAGNAQELVRAGHPLTEVIGCRDDIMTYLLGKQLEPIDAFKIMEDVRKGRGLRPDQEEKMKAHSVPDWYIDSCKKIKYMFPKAHAVAYVMMAVRIGWYKVHEPHNFYIQYLSLRCDAYEIETMTKGIEAVRQRMQDIQSRLSMRDIENPVSNKEKSLVDTLEVCEELYARGYRIANVDLYKSKATRFSVEPEDPHTIIPPFNVVDGLGDNVARSIEEARGEAGFLSKEDILRRTQLSGTLLKKLEQMGCLEGLSERNQMSLF